MHPYKFKRVFWQVVTDIAGVLLPPPPAISIIHFYPEDRGCMFLQIFISYHNAQLHNPQRHTLDGDVSKTVEKKKTLYVGGLPNHCADVTRYIIST